MLNPERFISHYELIFIGWGMIGIKNGIGGGTWENLIAIKIG